MLSHLDKELLCAEGFWVREISYLPKNWASQQNSIVISPLPEKNSNLITPKQTLLEG